MRKALLTIALLAALLATAAPVGQWTLFHCYRDITQIAATRADVYALASGNLFSLHPADNSLTVHDATTTLSTSAAITSITPAGETLIIVYNDATLDLLTPSGATYVADIRDADITGSKLINSVLVDGTQAYLATDFGIVRLDIKGGYIVDTYQLATRVTHVSKDDTYLYAATPARGLLRCRLTDNLLNPYLWEPCGQYHEPQKEEYTQDPYRRCLWHATPQGLERCDLDGNATATPVRPDGPAAPTAYRLYLHGQQLYAARGAYSYVNYQDNPGLIMTCRDERWDTIPAPPTLPYTDTNCLAFDPRDPDHFFAGAKTGLYEYRGDRCVNTFNATNSTLLGMYNQPSQPTLVTSLCFTPDNALWAMTGWTDTFLNRYDGTRWQTFPHATATYTNRYAIDMLGAQYSVYHQSLFLVNCHALTPALLRYDITTDSLEVITPWQNEDGLTINLATYTDLAEDAAHNLWIATDGGPVYITADDLRAHRYTLQQHKVPRNDGTQLADYLLTGLTIRRIVHDADGTVWIATAGNGLYHISADLNTELAHFTTATSPLPADDVYDVLPDPATGRVWIATSAALCAYQSDSRPAGTEMTAETVTAYPNPVTPLDTRVTLTGLDPQTHIVFTTIAGRRLHEATATSASYTWLLPDGLPSGVILACLTRSDGTAGPVIKIAVIR